MPKQTVFPYWRGFNLDSMFCSIDSAFNLPIASTMGETRSPGFFKEDDFKMIADFGFNFVRIPMSYRVWSSVDDPFTIDEQKLAPLDDAVHYGDKYGLHVNLCMHRLPGYCINHDEKVEEKLRLFESNEAQEAAQLIWMTLAKRYARVDTSKLSFNLVNEPESYVTQLQYYIFADKIISSVRDISPDRLFIIDGHRWGDLPATDIMSDFKNVGFSCRGYSPRGVTHFGTRENMPDPIWPGMVDMMGKKQILWDRAKLDRTYGMWAALGENLNVGIHCGEFGCYNKVPHAVALSWMEDLLASLHSFNIGFAMWGFRGPFGVMDSNRADAEYVDCNGHQLDIKMLKLMQKY